MPRINSYKKNFGQIANVYGRYVKLAFETDFVIVHYSLYHNNKEMNVNYLPLPLPIQHVMVQAH